MRDPKEKKDVTICFKVTEDQKQQVLETAKKEGMSITEYAIAHVVPSRSMDNKPTPEHVVRMQNMANYAMAIAEGKDSEYADMIQTEVKWLWSSLK